MTAKALSRRLAETAGRWRGLVLACFAALTVGCTRDTNAPTQIPPSPTRSPESTVPPSATPAPLTPTINPTVTAPPTPTLAPTSTPSQTAALTADARFLARDSAFSLRVMSYNVNWDSIFPPLDPDSHRLRTASRTAAFRRIVAAIQPDVVCLQEINPERDPAQTAAILDEVLDEGESAEWAAASRRDSLIASRYPVIAAGYELSVPPFPQELAQAAALVDLPDGLFGGRDLYVICAHFKASAGTYDILLRQRQADVIMAQVGDALHPGGGIDLPVRTPFVILGDFNIYATDPANHLTTLLTGDIKNESSYGSDVNPDWDETELSDALPSHNALGQLTYTWRSDDAPQPPGVLDRIIFSDSVLAAAHGFVLNTTLMTEEALSASNLRADDVLLGRQAGRFDHLPLVVDFVLIP